MNKKRLVIFLLGILTATGMFFTIWFVAKINIYGTLTVSLDTCNNPSSSSFFVKAYTPTGREVQILSEKNKVSITGFYKEASLIFPCEIKIEKINIEYEGALKKYSVSDKCVNGQRIFKIPSDDIINKTFLRKTLALYKWIFSIQIIQEILLALFIILIIILSYLFYRNNRRKAKIKLKNAKRNLFKNLLVIFSGFLFWLIVVFIVLEIALRIFGSFYSSEQKGRNDIVSDKAFTILCLGDSFTYGIGAHANKSYPAQLEQLIINQEKIPIHVINAGICAGNTTQMLENIQKLLQKYHPDVVVMLFGMANSWNYYGYSKPDNFLYRLRTFKLIARIIHNIRYKRYGFEMFQRVNDFSNQQLVRAFYAVINNDNFETAYNIGRYYLAKKEWRNALDKFSYASKLSPINDSIRDAFWVCLEKLDINSYFRKIQKKSIQNTLVPETICLLDSLVFLYPESVDLKIIKYRYHLIKGDTAYAKEEIVKYCKKHPENTLFYFDLTKAIPYDKRMRFFKQNQYLLPERSGFLTAYGYLSLLENKTDDALKCFLRALEFNPEEPFSQIGIDICNIQKTKIIAQGSGLKTTNKLFKFLITELAVRIYKIAPLEKTPDLNYKEKMFFDHFLQNDILQKGNIDSLFVLYSGSAVMQYLDIKDMFHDDFFLVHKNKRSIDLKEKEVFEWIESDINTISGICIKQGYPLICMNYPLIPPPSSEEISFWAAHVGEIWQKMAKAKAIPFINQDSLFTAYGSEKSELFEPAFTGSEHCNEKGYRLMAYNIYICMKQQGYFSKKNLQKRQLKPYDNN
jgi:tetratricopeptide (TPR) repeat protein